MGLGGVSGRVWEGWEDIKIYFKKASKEKGRATSYRNLLLRATYIRGELWGPSNSSFFQAMVQAGLQEASGIDFGRV